MPGYDATLDPAGVRKRSDAVEKMQEAWDLASALMGGTLAMRRAGEKYLPQWPGECDPAYKFRAATATLFPAFARTVGVLTGKPFSKPISIGEDVPDRLAKWMEDVDTEGRNLHAFAADLCRDALGYGFCGILVDFPKETEGLRTVADEQAAGVRPYFVHVKHDAVLGWKAQKSNGRLQLTQLRLLEHIEEEDGRFGTKLVEQVRVLEPGRWETWRKTKVASGEESWQLHDEGDMKPVGSIPFVPAYGLRLDHMVGYPPMLELAHLNVEHWQSKSDQQTILNVARIPILFARGLERDGDIQVGAGAIVRAYEPDADMKYVEHGGAAIEAGRLSILDLEDRMRQIGAELLVIKPGNTTEVQTRSDNEPAMCDLQRIMQSIEDAIDLALSYMAEFAGEKTGGHVTIFSDFGVATLAEASAQLLADMHGEGALSHETLLNELKRRGVLSADVDVDKEIAQATAEADAMQAKAAERERAMLMQNMAEAAQQEMDASPISYRGSPGQAQF